MAEFLIGTFCLTDGDVGTEPLNLGCSD